MRNQITNYIRAGYPGINIVSCEEARIESELKAIAESIGHGVHGWSITQGLADAKDGHRREAPAPVAAIVAREKAEEAKKGGLLEAWPTAVSLNEVGGLDQLKAWQVQRREAFGKEAHQYGLPAPKGLLIVGIPGPAPATRAPSLSAPLRFG